ncbi:MAG: O-antigen ligase family protein [Elusimicrobia bacterium]|nr:O-antigen ligase family protein [Elusimicrobiota bacterium]
MNTNKLNYLIFYLFIFLFFVVSLVPFQILDIRFLNFPFHYYFIGIFVFLLLILSIIQSFYISTFDKWIIFVILGFSLSLISSINRIHTIRVLSGFLLKGICIAYITERISHYKSESAIKILLICASLVASFGLTEYFFKWDLYPRPRNWPYFMIRSTIGNPLPFAAYLVLFFPLSVWYLENERKIIKYLPFLLITFAIIFSFSRSSWISLFCVIIIFYSDRQNLKNVKKNIRYIIILIIVIFASFVLMTKPVKEYFNYKFNVKMFNSAYLGNRLSFRHRLKSYKTTLNIIKDYPFFGVGLGNYPKIHEKYMVEGVRRDIKTPDNMYLRLLCDIGIVGTTVFFISIGYWMLQLWKSRNNILILAIFSGLAGFLINQTMADLMLWTAPQFAFWMLLGYGVGNLKENELKNSF